MYLEYTSLSDLSPSPRLTLLRPSLTHLPGPSPTVTVAYPAATPPWGGGPGLGGLLARTRGL